MTSVDTARVVWSADAIVGSNVHAILWQRRISQKEFADKLGISDSVLSKRLRGVSAWSVQDMLDVASLLGIEPEKLLKVPTVPRIPLQFPPFEDFAPRTVFRRQLRAVPDLAPEDQPGAP